MVSWSLLVPNLPWSRGGSGAVLTMGVCRQWAMCLSRTVLMVTMLFTAHVGLGVV